MTSCLYCSRKVGCIAVLCDRCATILLTAEMIRLRGKPDRSPCAELQVMDLVADTGEAS